MDNLYINIFKCLADKSRLQIINNLMKEPMYVELLSKRLNLSASTVSFHLKKLEDVKLVYSVKEQYYVVYHLNEDILSLKIKDCIINSETDKDIETQREEEYRKNVINSFFFHGKLKSIPVQQKKKKIVMEEISKNFDPNRSYSEKEVNIILADFNEDFCTIRRDMVDFKIFKRDHGIYTLISKEN